MVCVELIFRNIDIDGVLGYFLCVYVCYVELVFVDLFRFMVEDEGDFILVWFV